jgi:hypothetical protein
VDRVIQICGRLQGPGTLTLAVLARLLPSEDWSQAVRAFGEERAQVERALTKAEDLMNNLWAQEMRDKRSPRRC